MNNEDPIAWEVSSKQSNAFNVLCSFEVTLSRLCLAFLETEFEWNDAHEFAEKYGKRVV
jgi:hypothetical protein